MVAPFHSHDLRISIPDCILAAIMYIFHLRHATSISCAASAAHMECIQAAHGVEIWKTKSRKISQFLLEKSHLTHVCKSSNMTTLAPPSILVLWRSRYKSKPGHLFVCDSPPPTSWTTLPSNNLTIPSLVVSLYRPKPHAKTNRSLPESLERK